MNKVVCVICVGLLIVGAAGCASKVYTVTKERVDINVAGNQGFIFGPPPAAHTVQNPNRNIINLDVELPTVGEGEEQPQPQAEQPKQVAEDKGVSGNAGIVSQAAPEPAPEPAPAPAKVEKIK